MSKIKLAYLTNSRLPTEKAYGIQMAHTMKAFSSIGVDVTYVGTKRPNPITKSIFEYYNFSGKSFKTKYISSISILLKSRIGFWVRVLTYALGAYKYVKSKSFDIVFSREPLPLFFLTDSVRKTVYEMHDFPKTYLWFHKKLCQKVSHIVTTNTWAKEMCIKNFSLSAEKILVCPNGFDESTYSSIPTKINARGTLSFPQDTKIVMYSGHLYKWKGVETLAKVAGELPEIIFVFVGGHVTDRQRLQKKYAYKNIVWVEHQEPKNVPKYLAASDILVIPNIPINQHSIYSTSPIKLFEYMASKRPIVASRLPSIESMVEEGTVHYFDAGDVVSLRKSILDIFEEKIAVEKMVEKAYKYSQQFTWKSKAYKIIFHLGLEGDF